jgi:hypothetical protein
MFPPLFSQVLKVQIRKPSHPSNAASLEFAASEFPCERPKQQGPWALAYGTTVKNDGSRAFEAFAGRRVERYVGGRYGQLSKVSVFVVDVIPLHELAGPQPVCFQVPRLMLSPGDAEEFVPDVSNSTVVPP